jgi:hypothetical protein
LNSLKLAPLFLAAAPLTACRLTGASASVDGGTDDASASVPVSSAIGGASASPPPVPAATAAWALRPACDARLPPLGPRRPFKHKRSSLVAVAEPRHRGRDLFLRPGSPQWVIAKFAYGPSDKDLEDEEIDVYLLRGCGAVWENLGTYRTSDEKRPHPTVEGIEDRGGRVYLDLAKVATGGVPPRPLDVGRHRVRLVVAGDGTGTDLFLEVLPSGARVAVTDVDGTLTESEAAVLAEFVNGKVTPVHPGAAETMRALASSGHYLFYLTARPEWLVEMTRVWLSQQGFPPGILHTTVGLTGAMGAPATDFKSTELAWLKASVGIVPSFGFGNKPTDVATYIAAGIPAARSYYYRLDVDPGGGVRLDDYRTLAASLLASPP